MARWVTARLQDDELTVTLAGQRAWNVAGATATAFITPPADDPDVIAIGEAMARLLAGRARAINVAAIGAAFRQLERAKDANEAPADALLPEEE